MSLELRKYNDGSLRPYWFGRYKVNGRRYFDNLDVKISGTPPASLSLKDEGDTAFERSRAAASAKLASIVEEARTKRDSARLVAKIYEIKTGEQIRSVSLENLADEWSRIPRRRKPNARYAEQCRSALGRFVSWIKSHNPDTEELGHVTRSTASAFMEAEAARGITAKTWNDLMKLLRATCKYLLPAGSINPFFGMPTRETETVFRKPFAPNELKAILDAAKDDDFIRPIIMTGICTAMRRGDCCLLKWASVDLVQKFITVKTAKTGVTVAIPIFPMLCEELSRTAKTSEYVFPKQAKMYLENPDGITWRVRTILADAGFKDSDPSELESTSNAPAVNSAVTGTEIHVVRAEGLRRASIRDFHSFRVTWVTLALTASVPLELVQKVTGHKTVDIVLKHYFQPGREAFRHALQTAMPRLLTNSEKTPKDQILGVLDRATAKSWKSNVKKLRELVALLP